MEENLLDYERIKAWAEGKEAGYEVGMACTNGRCPLANYLRENTGKSWSVGPSIRPADGTRNRIDKPAWIIELIDKVDAFAGDDERIVPVTREQFLQILEQVKP